MLRLHARGAQTGTDGTRGAALFADHLAEIRRRDAQQQHGAFIFNQRFHSHLVRLNFRPLRLGRCRALRQTFRGAAPIHRRAAGASPGRSGIHHRGRKDGQAGRAPRRVGCHLFCAKVCLADRLGVRGRTGDVTYPEVRRKFDQRIAAGEFQTVPGSKHSTGRQFTTPETIRMERSAVKTSRLGQETADPLMQPDAAARQANSRLQLNDGQRKAIEEYSPPATASTACRASHEPGRPGRFLHQRRCRGERLCRRRIRANVESREPIKRGRNPCKHASALSRTRK